MSSGRSLVTSWNSTKRVLSAARSTATGIASIEPPAALGGGANSVGRTATTFTGVVSSTSAITFPAHMGRRRSTLDPSPANASTSVAAAAPSFAATRGMRSFPKAVAAPTIQVALARRAASATKAGVALGQVVLERRRIGQLHRDAVAGELRGRRAQRMAHERGLQPTTGAPGELLAGGQRRQARVPELPVRLLRDDEDVRHVRFRRS